MGSPPSTHRHHPLPKGDSPTGKGPPGNPPPPPSLRASLVRIAGIFQAEEILLRPHSRPVRKPGLQRTSAGPRASRLWSVISLSPHTTCDVGPLLIPGPGGNGGPGCRSHCHLWESPEAHSCEQKCWDQAQAPRVPKQVVSSLGLKASSEKVTAELPFHSASLPSDRPLPDLCAGS